MSKIPSSRSSNPSPRPRTITPILTNGNRRESSTSFRLGERVKINEKTGVIAYVGPTQFAAGEWIGVILDRAEGKNDGSCAGVRYFRAEPNHGLFCRPERVQHLNPQENLPDLQIGDRVFVAGKKYGFLKYIGPIHVAQGIWCGVKLDEPVGKNNGKIDGRRYFRCQHRFGLFAPIHRIEKIQLSAQEKRLLARQSMICATSFDRSNDSASDDDDERSNSSLPLSNGFSLFKTRSPPSPVNNVEETHFKDLQKQLEKLQKEYEQKIHDYETLITEQFAMKQKIDELKYQLEEYQLAALAKEEQIVIPEGFQLISNEQFERYESLEDLLRSKQKQIEELKDKEILREKQMRDDQEKFERRLNELSAQLKYHQDVLFPQYEKEREELKLLLRMKTELEEKLRQYDESLQRTKEQLEIVENRCVILQEEKRRTDEKLLELQNENFAERQKQFEEDIRTYQKNVEEAKIEIERIEEELNRVQQEKIESDRIVEEYRRQIEESKKEEQINETIEELNRIYQEKERQAELVRREQQNEYEEQIRNYEKNLTETTIQIETIEKKVKELEEEKLQSERKSDEIIRQLKENSNVLQSQIHQFENERNASLPSTEEIQALREENQHKTTLLKETKSLYEKELDEYQKDLELAVRERDELEEKLKEKETLLESVGKEFENYMAKLQSEDRTKIEELANEKEHWEEERKKLEEELQHLREEFEEKIEQIQNVKEENNEDELLRHRLNEFEEENRTLKEQYVELQMSHDRERQQWENEFEKLKKINDDDENLANQLIEIEQVNENLRRDLEKKINDENLLRKQIDEFQMKIAEVKSQYMIEMENMQLDHEHAILKLKNELDKVRVDEELQRKYEDLLAGQTSLERSFQEKIEQENALQMKLNDYEMKLALMKSENMVEIENMRYDYEQMILKLKAQIQSTPTKGKK